MSLLTQYNRITYEQLLISYLTDSLDDSARPC